MFGTGFRNIKLTEIEVLRDNLGKPYVNLYGEAKKLAEKIGITNIHVSITNTAQLASAFVVGESWKFYYTDRNNWYNKVGLGNFKH